MSAEIAAAMSAVQALEDRLADLEDLNDANDIILRRLREKLGIVTDTEQQQGQGKEGDESSMAELQVMKTLQAINKCKEVFDAQTTYAKCAELATEATGALAKGASKNVAEKARFQAVKRFVDGLVNSTFELEGFGSGTGRSELQKAAFLCGDENVNESLRDHLSAALEACQDAEERVLLTHALGEAKFQARKRDETMMVELMQEVEAALIATEQMRNPEVVKKAYITQIVTDGGRIVQQLRAMKNPEEIDDFVSELNIVDKKALLKFQALQQVMQKQHGGGHSHNGVPCQGHGHQQQSGHDHSHGGGHDHSHGGGHDHSHGGGHHDDDDDEEEEMDHHDHGHSHDGGKTWHHSHG